MRPRRLDAFLLVTLGALSAAPGCHQEPRPAEQGALPTQLQTPSQPGSGEPNLSVTPDGAVLLSWLEPAGEGAQLKVRRVAPDGPAGPALPIADSGSSRSSGFPRMATSGREVVFAWRDRADPPQVRTAVLELP